MTQEEELLFHPCCIPGKPHTPGQAAIITRHVPLPPPAPLPYVHRLAAQNEEVLSSHHHKTHELLAQNLLNFIRLSARG